VLASEGAGQLVGADGGACHPRTDLVVGDDQHARTPAGFSHVPERRRACSYTSMLRAAIDSGDSHATVAGPLQGVAEISFGVFLLLGLLTRPVALAAFLFLTSLWISEWGTAWIWELLIPMIASFSIMVGGAGRRWGIDAKLARKYPGIPLW